MAAPKVKTAMPEEILPYVCNGPRAESKFFVADRHKQTLEEYRLTEVETKAGAGRRALNFTLMHRTALATAFASESEDDIHTYAKTVGGTHGWRAFIGFFRRKLTRQRGTKSKAYFDLCLESVDREHVDKQFSVCTGVAFAVPELASPRLCGFALFATLPAEPVTLETAERYGLAPVRSPRSYMELLILCAGRYAPPPVRSAAEGKQPLAESRTGGYGSALVEFLKKLACEDALRLIYVEVVRATSSKSSMQQSQRAFDFYQGKSDKHLRGQGFLQADDACDPHLQEVSRCDEKKEVCRMTACVQLDNKCTRSSEADRAQRRPRDALGYVPPSGYAARPGKGKKRAPPYLQLPDVGTPQLQKSYQWPLRTGSRLDWIIFSTAAWQSDSEWFTTAEHWALQLRGGKWPTEEQRQKAAINLYVHNPAGFFQTSAELPLEEAPLRFLHISDLIDIVARNPERYRALVEQHLPGILRKWHYTLDEHFAHLFRLPAFHQTHLDRAYTDTLFWLMRLLSQTLEALPTAQRQQLHQQRFKSLIDNLYCTCVDFVSGTRGHEHTRISCVVRSAELNGGALPLADVVFAVKFDVDAFHDAVYLRGLVRAFNPRSERDRAALLSARLDWYLLQYLAKYLEVPAQLLSDETDYAPPATTPLASSPYAMNLLSGRLSAEIVDRTDGAQLLQYLLANDHADLVRRLVDLPTNPEALRKITLADLAWMNLPHSRFLQSTKETLFALAQRLQEAEGAAAPKRAQERGDAQSLF